MDIHEFHENRERRMDLLMSEEHRGIKRFLALDSGAYRDDALDGRTKELLGLVASTVLRCQECITHHAEKCLERGWSKDELLDALNVALIVGGSITIPHIREVWETIAQIDE
jgi:AhpD family alkylhydroperoxidase